MGGMKTSPLSAHKQKPTLSGLLLMAVLMGLGLSTSALHAESPPAIHNGHTPSAWLDDNDLLWGVFVHNRQAWLSRSTDFGQSWTEAVAVNEAPEDIEHNGENRPKVIVDPEHDTVYVSWTVKTEGMHTGDIRFTRSLDGGRTFEAVRTINDDGLLTSHRFDSLMLTGQGTLYLTWLDKRNLEYAREHDEDYEGSGVFYAVSSDQGKTFSSNHLIADHSCECCRIAVAPHGENGMALMWRHVYDNSTRDHAIATIDADGSVTTKHRASVDDWQIAACPHHGPDMTRGKDDNEYHLTWFSNGNINRGLYYGRHNVAAGVTQPVFQVDGNPGAGHPQIAEFDSVLYLVWKRFDGEQTRLFLRTSKDNGNSWSEPQTLLGTEQGSDHPLLTHNNNGLYVSWLTDADGYQFVPVATAANSASTTNTEPAGIKAFTNESFAQILEDHQGQEFLLALWSVHCPPCMVELQMLGELRKEYPDLPLVLISTDPIENREDAMDFLIRYQLDDMPSWMFAERFSERLRFSIDPQWFGELPRSYHFDTDHESTAHSGILSEEQVRDWLRLP